MRASLRSVSTVGLLGFGAFGRLTAHHLQPWFALRVHDPYTPVPTDPAGRGLAPATLAEAAACDVVILAVPVPALAATVAAIRPHLRPGALVLDVGSVKLEPSAIMAAGLPEHVEILATHPLFGPQSARDGVRGLGIALCPVRSPGVRRVAAFLRRALGLKVHITTADAHDREAAMVQGLTHLIARILVEMEPLPRTLTTRSFSHLMQAVEMVRHDAPEVFLAIERANPHAKAVRDRFFDLAAQLRRELDAAPGH
ncbi:MAG TPA: prephenate dehydrogenase/arogenate dehydrogenase family protein [Brevundimonas sp.]|jgi:prephenate dehydrogenase|uniref:prephenate dehydrogenase/arogenate dehydrogenase family protein n=1 Tax=Brevundimonas sp. TaxID=1871086 RepID=UPI002E10BE0A|nr:prephenate dehydrogenase/arogenate dehydrogenase family protein [Brevundimonas sp.]